MRRRRSASGFECASYRIFDPQQPAKFLDRHSVLPRPLLRAAEID
jgi:hypothetical protein